MTGPASVSREVRERNNGISATVAVEFPSDEG